MTATQHRTVDVLVVGAGTGMLAAISAADAGLDVLLVEKSPYLGGSTAISGGGFWIPNNSILREHGIPDSLERATTYLDALVGPLGDLAPRERYLNFLHHGPAAVEMLRKYAPNNWAPMYEYPDYFTEVDGGSPRGRAVESAPMDAAQLEGDRPLLRSSSLEAPVPMPITGADFRWMNLMTRTPKGGAKIIKRVIQGVGGKMLRKEMVAGGQALGAGLIIGLRKAGVQFLINTPLKELIVEDGKVVGAVLDQDGDELTVRVTKGVILASGGFDHDMEMRHDYQSEVLQPGWGVGAESNEGDVHKIAQEAGAALTLMDQAWWFPVIPASEVGPSMALLSDRSLPGSIMVDQTGKRFMNEAINYMSAGQIMLGHDDGEEPHYPIWMVFDQTHRNRYLLATAVFPRQPLPKAWFDAGIAHQADTIEGLAVKLGLPELPATVARFNLMAGQGKDDDFARGESQYDHYYSDPSVKPNPNLAPLDKAPFYAVSVAPGDLGTCGGVKADEFGRALRENGEVIDGLYAIGNAAGNAFGTFYPGPGCTIGQGMAFGHIAAQHMAGKLG